MLNMMPSFSFYKRLRSTDSLTKYELCINEWAELTGAIKKSNWCYSIQDKQLAEFTALLMDLNVTDIESVNRAIGFEQDMINKAHSLEQFDIYTELEKLLIN